MGCSLALLLGRIELGEQILNICSAMEPFRSDLSSR